MLNQRHFNWVPTTAEKTFCEFSFPEYPMYFFLIIVLYFFTCSLLLTVVGQWKANTNNSLSIAPVCFIVVHIAVRYYVRLKMLSYYNSIFWLLCYITHWLLLIWDFCHFCFLKTEKEKGRAKKIRVQSLFSNWLVLLCFSEAKAIKRMYKS